MTIQSDPVETPKDESLTVGKSRPRINKYFDAVTKLEASDLHLKADAVPRLRKGGELRATNSPPLTNEDIDSMVKEILSPDLYADLHSKGAIDTAYATSKTERFRLNIFKQRGNVSLVARRINPKIPNFSQLHLPDIFSKIADFEQGLVMVAGITGSGKSTTLAAMLQQVNENRQCHIVTIEDPIEYHYSDKKAFINQREVGLDVASYDLAIRSLMREDPDVILIGEMRDKMTFAAAVQAAETGHMVFSTIHASSAAGSITRILELFPTDQHTNIRQAIAANLRAVIYQKLVASIEPGVERVPVVEVMLGTPPVRKYIIDGRENELVSVIRGERGAGMIDFNDMLSDLVKQEKVSPKEAYAASPNPDELRMRMKGISSL
jgi:twitching motility protein PilT